MKKVLFCTEFHKLNSGYSTYGKRLLTDLHATGKYEIAELAGYATAKDAQECKAPWKVFHNKPEEDSPEYKQYKAKDVNQFGAYRFEEVCVDFKPDVVACFRDPWMEQFQYYSPLRGFYRWIIMPPIDSYPLKEEWLEVYKNADALLTYNVWARETIYDWTNGNIQANGVGKYAIEDTYKPVPNRDKIKEELGIPVDSIVFGTVMRNQIRKQIPDLLRSFSNYLLSSPPQIAKRSYLYIHTSFPDKQCWDIPSLLTEFQFFGNVYFSYICKRCKKTFCSIWRDALTKCDKCGYDSAVLPNVTYGHTTEDLAKIYNAFDLYIQASNCEGFGFPILEAAACGTPIACVDHSGMKQLNDDLDGYKIKVAKDFRIIEGNVDRACMDNNSLVSIMKKFAGLNIKQKEAKRNETLKLVKKHYNWPEVVQTWERVIDELAPAKRKWTDPAIRYDLDPQIPNNLSNRQFVDYIFDNILLEPDNKYNSFASELVRDLCYGMSISGGRASEVTREKLLNSMIDIAKFKQAVELMRLKSNG